MEGTTMQDEARDEVSEEELDNQIKQALDEIRSRIGGMNRKSVDLSPLLVRHSKHARYITINGKQVKFHMTKRRPWVLKDERRKKNKRSKLARKKNR